MLNDVKVIDDVFEYSELNHLYKWCAESPMFYNQIGDSGFKGLGQIRFSSHFESDNNSFVESVKSNVLTPSNIDTTLVKCYESYINFYDFSTPTVIHDDFAFYGKSITVLFFSTKQWTANWGGEIIFYDKKLEAIKVVSYKPNRFVIFDGSIPHAVKQPSVIAQQPRYSITTKFCLKDD